LLANTTDVVVADFVEVTLLILALDGLTFAVNDRVLCDDAELWGIHLDNLELDLSHATSACEEVALADGSVCLAEVGSEEDVEEGAGDTLNCVGDRKDCNTLGLWWVSALKGSNMCRETHVFDVRAGVDGNDVAVLDTEVVADNAVDAGLTILEIVVGENDQDGVLALLSLDQNGIATEELESLHGVVREGDDGVVIVGGVSNTRSWSV